MMVELDPRQFISALGGSEIHPGLKGASFDLGKDLERKRGRGKQISVMIFYLSRFMKEHKHEMRAQNPCP